MTSLEALDESMDVDLKSDAEILRSLSVDVNGIVDSRLKFCKPPRIGELVFVANYNKDEDPECTGWRLLAPGGEGYLDDARIHHRFRSVEYGSFNDNGTWILQKKSGRRNPIWTCREYNNEGEGEFEQRHAIVLRCATSGVYSFYFFESVDDEIAAIERTACAPISTLYVNKNRISAARIKEQSARHDILADDAAAGAFCLISDYIYFSDLGCYEREKVYSTKDPVPKYTKVFFIDVLF